MLQMLSIWFAPRCIAALAIACIAHGAAGAQEVRRFHTIEPMVRHIHRNGQSFFQIVADGFVRAAPNAAWQVLIDYERLPQFVPNLSQSRILSRDGNVAVIEQESQAGFLFVSRHIHMVVRVTEQPYSMIDVNRVSGDMKHYSARWQLAPATEDGVAGTRISYTGEMEPDFFVPPLVGEALVENDVRKMVEAVAAEIDRAQAR